MDKITKMIGMLTNRYGAPVLKDGQTGGAIANAFRLTLSHYSEKDITAAATAWMQTSKYPRWPEPAELVEIMRGFGAIPESKMLADNIPAHVKQAQADVSRWYAELIAKPIPRDAWPLRWDDVVAHIIGADKPENSRNTFAYMLTRAWLDGVIPNDFGKKADAYFAEMLARKAKYLAGVNEYGAARVHESKRLLQQLMNQ